MMHFRAKNMLYEHDHVFSNDETMAVHLMMSVQGLNCGRVSMTNWKKVNP